MPAYPYCDQGHPPIKQVSSLQVIPEQNHRYDKISSIYSSGHLHLSWRHSSCWTRAKPYCLTVVKPMTCSPYDATHDRVNEYEVLGTLVLNYYSFTALSGWKSDSSLYLFFQDSKTDLLFHLNT